MNMLCTNGFRFTLSLRFPVRPRPCGFLAVRNPKRYVDKHYAGMFQLLAFVALTNINGKAAQKLQNMVYTPDDIKMKMMYYKLF